jgi:hypothetical protein
MIQFPDKLLEIILPNFSAWVSVITQMLTLNLLNKKINLLELNKMEIKLSVLCLKLPTEWVMIMKSSEIEIE